MTQRSKFRVVIACALLILTYVAVPGFSRADGGTLPYPFSCNSGSLTADFAARDALPQSQEPPDAWYRTDAQGHYQNGGWGPRANALPAPDLPQNAGCDTTTWKRERILAVAARYIYSPDNPLGLQYRHHHIPAWAPPTSTYAGAPAENPDTDAPEGSTAWGSGQGLDCSNFTAWVYNYGLGVKFGGGIHQQADGTAGPMGTHIPADGPFEPGDLVYLHPQGDSDQASHVVIYVDDGHIIDSRVSAQGRVGVQVRDRTGWYRNAVLGAWRPIG
ncbi:NlpC/P60 family protein [Mycobacterium sp. Marseille-P9652]|uniref:NlpC/P60 family protein n=1 Tax=Mycobacterium sp. Marseille-P9652 TaxID=2654950 RepID=UPI0018D065A8|nr:NlpC/P60 family protein [Mycobacterium sp. Marseille-P9652]